MKFLVLKTALLGCSLSLLSAVSSAQILATGLCDTGLTPKSPQPIGCTTSTLVTPVNPVEGGPSVDGNWQLVTPYPSVVATDTAPNPCTLATNYGPAWVNAPWYAWYNPDDNLSQWIEPLGGGYTPAGWYIYRTAFPVPPNDLDYRHYAFEVSGQLMSDNEVVAIFIEDPIGDHTSCRTVDAFGSVNQQYAWNAFKIEAAPVFPRTSGFLYFVVYNAPRAAVGENPTGLRVEFNSPEFLPY